MTRSIYNKFDKSGKSYRWGYSEGSEMIKEYSEQIESFPCHIQPSQASLSERLQGGFSKAWSMWCPVLDIKEGDKIEIDDEEYKVTAVQNFDLGGDPHLEVTMVINKS